MQVRGDLERHRTLRPGRGEAVDGEARERGDHQCDEHEQADEEDLHEQRVYRLGR